MKASASLISIAFASLTLAQQQYTIDPQNVPNATRQVWCTSQKTQCPLICLQTPGVTGAEVNTCDPNLLQYSCICSNGLSPNVTEYSETLPYFICTEWGTECVANCGNDNTCASACRQQHPCGAQNPTRVNLTTASASSSKTATASGSSSTSATIYTGLAGAAATAATGDAALLQPLVLQFGKSWGIVAVFAGLFGGFAILL